MTITHHVRVHRSDENLAREGQLAWHIAEVAADPVAVEPEVVEALRDVAARPEFRLKAL